MPSLRGVAMKKCIFCNTLLGDKGTPSGSSKEHIFPQWYLEQYKLRYEQLLVNVQEAASTTNLEQDLLLSLQLNEFPTERTPSANKFVHGKVCRQCNTGWMAKLEGKMAREFNKICTKSSNFEKINLDIKALLSNWAIKTAMVFNDYKPSEPHMFPKNTYQQMAKGKYKPPKHFHVFLTKMDFIDPFFISNVPSFVVSGVPIESAEIMVRKSVKVLFQMQNLLFLIIYWPNKFSNISYSPELCTPLTIGSHTESNKSLTEMDPRLKIALNIEFII